MRSRRKKFIISLLVLVMMLLPVRTVLATVAMDFSSNKTDIVMEVDVEKDVANLAQYYVNSNSNHCQTSGHDMQDPGMDDTCGQESCGQCGIYSMAVFSDSSLQFTDGYVDYIGFSHKGILSRLVVPPFRPPRA